jgi:hypothetical protein
MRRRHVETTELRNASLRYSIPQKLPQRQALALQTLNLRVRLTQ